MGVISLWKIEATNASTAPMANTLFNIDALLRGHEGQVNYLTASDTWSTLVSCGNEGMAVVWDMNRKRFLHRLLVEPEEPVRFAAINESEVSAREFGNSVLRYDIDFVSGLANRDISPCLRTPAFTPTLSTALISPPPPSPPPRWDPSRSVALLGQLPDSAAGSASTNGNSRRTVFY